MRSAIKLLIAGAAFGVASAAAAEDREIKGSADAKGHQSLRIEAHVGEVEIRTTDKDQIVWRLRLEPDHDDGWFNSRKDAARAIAEAKVKATAAGPNFELELELPRGTDFDDVEEHWEIEVPVRFAIDVESNVGRVEVIGPAGGVEAELNVGELRVEVPSGRVDVRANVGEVRVLSANKSPGEIRLNANIGDVDLRIGDKRVQAERGFALGGGISASQGGKDDINAKVNVGEVIVRVD